MKEYKGALTSPNFLTRSLAVFGHLIVAQLIFLAFFFVCGMIIGFFSMLV